MIWLGLGLGGSCRDEVDLDWGRSCSDGVVFRLG